MNNYIFRCWDDKKHKMYYSSSPIRFFIKTILNNITIMQYIGLNDIRNRKIFTGDILFVNDDCSYSSDIYEQEQYHHYWVGIVSFIPPSFILTNIKGKPLCYYESVSELFSHNTNKSFSVILGNIYENENLYKIIDDNYMIKLLNEYNQHNVSKLLYGSTSIFHIKGDKL